MNNIPKHMPGFTAEAALSRTKEDYRLSTARSGEGWIRFLPAFTALHFNQNCGPVQCKLWMPEHVAITSVIALATSLSLRDRACRLSVFITPFPAPGGNESGTPPIVLRP